MPPGDFNEDLEFGVESTLNLNRRGLRPNRSATIYNKKIIQASFIFLLILNGGCLYNLLMINSGRSIRS